MIPVLMQIIVVTVDLYLSHRPHTERQPRCHSRFPPRSDEEFVHRCSPGIAPEVAIRVRSIVADQLGIPYERYPESHFVNDLGCY